MNGGPERALHRGGGSTLLQARTTVRHGSRRGIPLGMSERNRRVGGVPWHVRARLWLPWLLIPSTVLLALVVGRGALLLWCVFGVYVVFCGLAYIARPSAWDDLVRWRRSASDLALWTTGFTRSAEYEHRVVAGAIHILVGIGFALVGIAGATAA